MDKTQPNNTFSLQRLWALFKMEWKLEGSNFIFFNLIIALSLLASILLRYYPWWDMEDSLSDTSVVTSLYTLVLIAYFFYFLFFMSNRLWQSKGVTFCTLPTSTLERFSFLVAIGIICAIAPSLIVWVMRLVEAIFNPLLRTAETAWFKVEFLAWFYKNPHTALALIGGVGTIQSFFFYAMTKQSSPFMAILIYFVTMAVICSAAIAVIWICYKVFPDALLDWEYHDDGRDNYDDLCCSDGGLSWIHLSIFWLFDIILFWAGYKQLKKLQLK